MQKEPYIQKLVKLSLTIIVAFSTLCGLIFVFGAIGIGSLVFFLSRFLPSSEPTLDLLYGNSDAPHTFVSIPIVGVIVGSTDDISDPFGFFTESVTYGYKVKEQLMSLAEDSGVDGVILEINSPGGTIYGANAIADGVSYYKKKTNKPVYSFVSGLAASGAYWAAAATDTIIADVGTGVGSIGVISGPYQFYDGVVSIDGGAFTGGVVTQRGIQTSYITAGTSKDFGNPFRKMTEKEIRSVQTMVDNEYDSFVSYVSLKRDIPKQIITDSIGALVYDTKKALDYSLIDRQGSKEEAYEQLAAAVSLSPADIRVVRDSIPMGFFSQLFSLKRIGEPKRSLCTITKTHLVYYGNVTALCQ